MTKDIISILTLLLAATFVVVLAGERIFKNTSRIIGLAFSAMGIAGYVGVRFFGLNLPGGERFNPRRLEGDDALAAALFLCACGVILFVLSPLETAVRRKRRRKELFRDHVQNG